MKNIIASIYMQIGVNIIGLPEFHKLTPPVYRRYSLNNIIKYNR